MWRSVTQRWAQHRSTFQIMFVAVVALGMFFGMRPTPPFGSGQWLMTSFHMAGLLVCTLLSYLAFPRWRWWLRFGMMSGVGLSVEFVQYFHPTRSADLDDLFANTIGVVMGLVAIAMWQRRNGWNGLRAESS
ncbi:VanZ like family protein [Halopseudomonas xinjiangensis]|uniref:VanZ like family protein n=1 Tax=Halopseudomonas xinjiangensis TaxID=487184 RepID=A0A1H1NJH8_9GAMM|nr:VanZ family protein [Halopseudomonas xinjiangensis]SDR98990.1 VanZ like family protein [Halopseudomonas xinjiangensis]